MLEPVSSRLCQSPGIRVNFEPASSKFRIDARGCWPVSTRYLATFKRCDVQEPRLVVSQFRCCVELVSFCFQAVLSVIDLDSLRFGQFRTRLASLEGVDLC